MRKLLTISLLILAMSTSAFAAPNDSSDRGPSPVARVIRIIKRIIGVIHPMDDIGQVTPPIPS